MNTLIETPSIVLLPWDKLHFFGIILLCILTATLAAVLLDLL